MGCIPLGEDYLDDESILCVVAGLTEVVSVCLQRYPVAPAGDGSAAAAIGASLHREEQRLLNEMKREVMSIYVRYEEAQVGEDGDVEDEGEEGEEVERVAKRANTGIQ